jgi:hypothetical protein
LKRRLARPQPKSALQRLRHPPGRRASVRPAPGRAGAGGGVRHGFPEPKPRRLATAALSQREALRPKDQPHNRLPVRLPSIPGRAGTGIVAAKGLLARVRLMPRQVADRVRIAAGGVKVSGMAHPARVALVRIATVESAGATTTPEGGEEIDVATGAVVIAAGQKRSNASSIRWTRSSIAVSRMSRRRARRGA